jgi:hypothetical protein
LDADASPHALTCPYARMMLLRECVDLDESTSKPEHLRLVCASVEAESSC